MNGLLIQKYSYTCPYMISIRWPLRINFQMSHYCFASFHTKKLALMSIWICSCQFLYGTVRSNSVTFENWCAENIWGKYRKFKNELLPSSVYTLLLVMTVLVDKWMLNKSLSGLVGLVSDFQAAPFIPFNF